MTAPGPMGGWTIRDQIDRVHAMAATPSPADHEADPPHPYCFGDDPCICVQLIAACETEWVKAAERVEALNRERGYPMPSEFYADMGDDYAQGWVDLLGLVRSVIHGERP